MYGLKKTLRSWYKRFDLIAISLGYNILNSDHYTSYKRFENNNDFIILLFYIDDMLLACPNIELAKVLNAQLVKEFDMKDMDQQT